MRKEAYEEIKIEIVTFECEDVVTESYCSFNCSSYSESYCPMKNSSAIETPIIF